MGWWSGNQKYVNRRSERRFEEAKGLVEETGLLAEQQRDASKGFLEEGYRKRMSSEIMDAMESRNSIREAEDKAKERVARVTGNSPLAAARASLDFVSDDELQEQYGYFASNRADIVGAKKAGELQISSDYLQNLTTMKQQMASTLMSYQEQADEGMGGAVMNMVGTAAGTWMGCWVAREVYGQDNPKWMLFRSWLTEDSPRWFLSLYTKHGERFAQFISNKPWLKAIIRRWMNRKIAGRMIKVFS